MVVIVVVVVVVMTGKKVRLSKDTKNRSLK